MLTEEAFLNPEIDFVNRRIQVISDLGLIFANLMLVTGSVATIFWSTGSLYKALCFADDVDCLLKSGLEPEDRHRFFQFMKYMETVDQSIFIDAQWLYNAFTEEQFGRAAEIIVNGVVIKLMHYEDVIRAKIQIIQSIISGEVTSPKKSLAKHIKQLEDLLNAHWPSLLPDDLIDQGKKLTQPQPVKN